MAFTRQLHKLLYGVLLLALPLGLLPTGTVALTIADTPAPIEEQESEGSEDESSGEEATASREDAWRSRPRVRTQIASSGISSQLLSQANRRRLPTDRGHFLPQATSLAPLRQ